MNALKLNHIPDAGEQRVFNLDIITILEIRLAVLQNIKDLAQLPSISLEKTFNHFKDSVPNEFAYAIIFHEGIINLIRTDIIFRIKFTNGIIEKEIRDEWELLSQKS